MHPPRHPEEEDAFYAHQPEYLDANLNADSAYAQYDVPEAQYYSSYYPEAQEMDMVEDQTQYDAFENEILQQPVVDRRMQAAEGRARLTLPRATSGVAQRSPIHSLQETQRINGDIGLHAQLPRRDLSHFAYDGGLTTQSSSSMNEHASSPAYKASQRRLGPSAVESYRSHEEASVPDNCRDGRHAALEESGPHEYQSYFLNLPHAPTGLVQGIDLVATRELPDRFRSTFPFPVFNAIQSKSFRITFQSDDNLVLSSPTGSGKTAVLELAICRTVSRYPDGQYKIVYQAPTKALCSERCRDWEKKFRPLGLACAELTGDTDMANLTSVQNATIIITTPEKWDSMTRKWKDHEKLMQLVRLFLIDEVHILKEDRGATLEAVVSRMKSIGSQVRFVALSATVPNSDDIATWLGKDPNNQHIPAAREVFGESFRPVKLQKHVCGFQSQSNDFAFDSVLNSKLPDVITKYSHRKPIIVFCATRNGTESTAKLLAKWWAEAGPRGRFWERPLKPVRVMEKNLQGEHCVNAAVAFHHAGLELSDRQIVEAAFLAGNVNVICCTSTLAVGVNLPCHFVIIKNTVSYINGSMREYADLEVMQMLGRAGRPQFDDSAVAVIMTRQEKARHYEKMVSGQETLESCLHLNLTDHLNAEIGLGTITDAYTAKKWLTGTFLYVRLKQNPDHYRLEGDSGGRDLDERLDRICNRDIELLQEHDLVTSEQKLRSTEFGEAMARYYVKFATMKIFMGLPPKAKVSDILAVLSQAAEFQELRFRCGEKTAYKTLNDHPSIRYRVPVDLALYGHKVSILIQCVLGGIDFLDDEKNRKHRAQYKTEVAIVFQHVHRLIRCIIDCQLQQDDSVSVRNALMVARSLGARVWDDSALHMKQIEGIGQVTVRKLVNAGIKTVEELEIMESHRIEGLLSRNPPFGVTLHDRCKGFPKLRISLSTAPNPTVKRTEGVRLSMKADIGFLNDKVPVQFNKRPVYVCFLAETSDGRKVHFCRISAKKLDKGQDILFSALLTSPTQSVTCHVMCDDIAGTLREATLQPKIPASAFPDPRPCSKDTSHDKSKSGTGKPSMNTSRPRSVHVHAPASAPSNSRRAGSDDFVDNDLDDADLMQAENDVDDFRDIEDIEDDIEAPSRSNPVRNSSEANAASPSAKRVLADQDLGPKRRANGNWECNHQCKDKTKCSHLCCRDGMKKKPKAPKSKAPGATQQTATQGNPQKATKAPSRTSKTQSTLKAHVTKPVTAPVCSPQSPIAQIDLSHNGGRKAGRKTASPVPNPPDLKRLQSLHSKSQKRAPPSSITSVSRKRPQYSYASGTAPSLSFLPIKKPEVENPPSSDYGDAEMDDLPSALDFDVEVFMKDTRMDDAGIVPFEEELYEETDSVLEDAMVGLADSQDIITAHIASQPQARTSNRVTPGTTRDGSLRSYATDPMKEADSVQTSKYPERVAVAPSKEKTLFVTGDSSSSPVPDAARVSSNASEHSEGKLLKRVAERTSTPFQARPSKRFKGQAVELQGTHLDNENVAPPAEPMKESGNADGLGPDIPEKDSTDQSQADSLDSWFLREFGDIVEIV